MGAFKWQRGQQGEHKTFTLGVPQNISSGQRKRKANVWRRAENTEAPSGQQVSRPEPAPGQEPLDADAASAKRQRPEGSGSPDRSSSSQFDVSSISAEEQQPQASREADAQRLQQQQAELLQRKAERQAESQRRAEQMQRTAFLQQARITAQQAAVRELEDKAAAAARTAAEAAKSKREEEARRKARLDAGFAEAFRLARDAAATDAAQLKGTSMPVADSAEVARVLSARSHLECLQLPPNPSRDVLKRKYRTMAVALHPDKCKVTGATDAFQRLVTAYQALLHQVH